MRHFVSGQGPGTFVSNQSVYGLGLSKLSAQTLGPLTLGSVCTFRRGARLRWQRPAANPTRTHSKGHPGGTRAHRKRQQCKASWPKTSKCTISLRSRHHKLSSQIQEPSGESSLALLGKPCHGRLAKPPASGNVGKP